VWHSTSQAGAGGAVALALIAGARLASGPAGGAQGGIAQAAPCRENSTEIFVHLPPHGAHLPVHVPGQGGGRRGGAQGGAESRGVAGAAGAAETANRFVRRGVAVS